MAEKGFGVKEINLIGASGTPTIESPNNLNLNAVNVAISTNVSIGGTLTVTGNISAGGTVTYEDVTNVDSIGIITARQGVRINADSSQPSGNSATNYLSVGASQDLKLYHNGNQNYITAPDGTILIQADNIMLVSDDTAGRSLYQDNANNRLELGFDGTAAAYVSSSNVQFAKPITASTDGQHDIGTNSVRFRNAYVDTYYGSGANLTGIAVTEAPVVDYTITSNGASAYRFHGGGVNETADDPDLYLIRGQKYRFNNTTGTGHPFRFSHTGNANAAYSNGVTGDEDGVQFWTIPYDAPAKLFYVCTLHPGMVGNIYIRGANGQNENVGITTFSSNILTPQQVGCAVRMSTNISHPGNNSFNSGTSWVLPFDTEVWDIGSNFNTSNYTFTAPVTGRYLCCYTIQLETISSWVWNYIYPVVTGTGGSTNTVASAAAGIVFADDGGAGVTGGTNNTAAYRAFTNTVIMNLTAGQDVRLGVRGDMTATIKGTTETQWTMQLLG